MSSIVNPISSIPIRLPDERWEHICRRHEALTDRKQEVLQTVANPELILEGGEGELLAVTELEPNKWLVVVYRELEDDGFIITAYSTRRTTSLKKRRQIWP